jgi:hypothetical protein
MNETNSNNKFNVANIICKTIDKVNTAIPIQKIDSVSCFYNWLDSCYKLGAYGRDYIQADYYNGSENDLQNLFLEILALATTDHCFNGNYILKRLEFLAHEGLHMLEIKKVKVPSFKVSKDEANELIVSLAKKVVKSHTPTSKKQVKKNVKKAVELYKKNVKSSVGLKTIKKKPAKRDMKGRFSKNK